MTQIRTLSDLDMAAKNRKAVIVPGTVWGKPKPAVFLLFQQGARLLWLFNKGMFIYKKKEK